MKRRTVTTLFLLVFSALYAALVLSGCGRKQEPVPDLNGFWITVGKDGIAHRDSTDYYQFALIEGERMEVYWFTPRDASVDLYWSGSFVPPRANDYPPYAWDSVNNPERSKTSRFALRDETKTFVYKDGTITYNIMMGHIKMAMTLEPWQRPEDAPGPDAAS